MDEEQKQKKFNARLSNTAVACPTCGVVLERRDGVEHCGNRLDLEHNRWVKVQVVTEEPEEKEDETEVEIKPFGLQYLEDDDEED